MSDGTGPSDAARAYRRLWGADEPPDLVRFLGDSGPLRPLDLAAVLLVDQRERWRLGAGPTAAAYLHDFPALRDDPEAALELIYGEWLLREELGESPPLEDYLRSYPEHAEGLALQVELHRALEERERRNPSVRRRDRDGGRLRLDRTGPAIGARTDLALQAALDPRVRDPRGAGPRRDGGRLQGPPGRAQADRGAEDGPGRRPGRGREPGPLPQRGGGRRPLPAPEHRADLRLGRARRAPLRRARVRRGGEPGRSPRRHAPAAGGRGPAGGDARPGHPLRAPEGRRAPGPQAGQHPADGGRHAQDQRLRAGQAAAGGRRGGLVPRRPDPHRRRPGDPRLHGARAGLGATPGRPGRPRTSTRSASSCTNC